jgi:hypothetical protein
MDQRIDGQVINGLKDWDAWKSLDEGQRDFEVYRLLCSLDSRLCGLEGCQKEHKKAAFLGGIVGGAGTLSLIGIGVAIFRYLVP